MVHAFAELVVVHGRPPLAQRSYSLAETGHDPGEMPNFLAHVARLPVPAPAVTYHPDTFLLHLLGIHPCLSCESSQVWRGCHDYNPISLALCKRVSLRRQDCRSPIYAFCFGLFADIVGIQVIAYVFPAGRNSTDP